LVQALPASSEAPTKKPRAIGQPHVPVQTAEQHRVAGQLVGPVARQALEATERILADDRVGARIRHLQQPEHIQRLATPAVGAVELPFQA
jgi:hypothetical protein